MTTKRKRDIDGFVDSIDPSTMRDARYLRAVSAGRANLESAEAQLQRAVDDARAAGDSWTMIGIALGITAQDAHRKYGGPAAG